MSGKEISYTWSIEDKALFNKVINAKNGAIFYSDIFVIEDLKWQIEICPNGYKKSQMGSFQIYVKLIKLPELWKSLIINRTIESPQTQSSITVIATYDRSGHSRGWATNTLRLKELRDLKLNKIIINVKTKILRIILKENGNILYNYKFKSKNYKQTTLKWKLDSQTLTVAKRAYNGKCIVSDIFNDMWCMKLLPNGSTKDEKGKCMVGLQLCNFPLNVRVIDVEINVSIKQFGFNQTQTEKYKFLKGAQWVNVGTFAQLRKCKTVDIICNVLIVKEYDTNEREIGLKPVSEPKKAIKTVTKAPTIITKKAPENAEITMPQKEANNAEFNNNSAYKIAEKELKESQSSEPLRIVSVPIFNENNQVLSDEYTEPLQRNNNRMRVATNNAQIESENDKLLLFDAKINSLSANLGQIFQLNKEKDTRIQSLSNALQESKSEMKDLKHEFNYQMQVSETKYTSFVSNVSEKLDKIKNLSVRNESNQEFKAKTESSMHYRKMDSRINTVTQDVNKAMGRMSQNIQIIRNESAANTRKYTEISSVIQSLKNEFIQRRSKPLKEIQSFKSELANTSDVCTEMRAELKDLQTEMKNVVKNNNSVTDKGQEINTYKQQINYQMTLYDTKIKLFSSNINQNISQMQHKIQSIQSEMNDINDVESLRSETAKNSDLLSETAKEMSAFKEQSNYTMSLCDAKIKTFSANMNKTMSKMSANIKKMENDSKQNKKRFSEINQSLKRLSTNVKPIKKSVNVRNTKSLRYFFEIELKMPQYLSTITEAGFDDIAALVDLTKDDLREMGVKIAHRKKILKGIAAKNEPANAE